MFWKQNRISHCSNCVFTFFQAREAGEIDAEDISPSDSENSDDDDDDDDGDLPREHVQCAPS